MKKLYEDMGLIKRGLGEIHRICPGLLAAVLLQSVSGALFPFINIYMSAKIIDAIEQGEGMRTLFFYAAVTVTADLLVHLLDSLLRHMVSSMKYRLWERCRMQMGNKMMQMSYVDVESDAVHCLRQKIDEFRTMDGSGLWNLAEQFQTLIGKGFTTLFSVSLTVSMFTASFQGEAEGILSLAVSPMASLIMAAGILLNAMAGLTLGSRMTRGTHVIMNEGVASNRISSYYLDNHIMTYHGGKDIRIYNERGLLQEEMEEQAKTATRMCRHLFRNEAKYSGEAALVTAVTSTLVYLFVGLRAAAGMIGIGSVVLYIGSISKFTDGFTGSVTALAGLRSNNDAMKAYYEFMDIPDRMGKEDGAGGGQEPCGARNGEARNGEAQDGEARDGKTHNGEARAGAMQGEDPRNSMTPEQENRSHQVEFRDVSFRYPGSESWALRHVSLTFRTGRRMAVVGMNGSGKSTFIKLLCRLYDPTEGTIYMNGIDIRRYDYQEYLSLFSVVFQDFKLFSFTLGENVAVAESYPEEQVRDALVKAGMEEFLEEHGNSLATNLYRDFDKDGIEVSGGEAQKIALARAVCKGAPFVLLDEPTAALDPLAEYEIYKRFNELVADRTTVYISHRMSSCRFCGDIAVFHEGRMVQRGNHESLMAETDGKYHELWTAQAQYYQKKESGIFQK